MRFLLLCREEPEKWYLILYIWGSHDLHLQYPKSSHTSNTLRPLKDILMCKCHLVFEIRGEKCDTRNRDICSAAEKADLAKQKLAKPSWQS